jgi:hypothetical protein
MKRLTSTVVIGVGLLLTAGGRLEAQAYSPLNPRNNPAVSPWINLNRPFSDPAVNYFGLVRPEFAALRNFQQLQQGEAALSSQQQQLAGTVLRPTGHATGFQTQSRYFMTTGGRGAGSFPSVAGSSRLGVSRPGVASPVGGGSALGSAMTPGIRR